MLSLVAKCNCRLRTDIFLVWKPNIGTGVVVIIRQQPYFTFPRGVAGGRILLPFIWPTIGYPCYPGFNYSD